MKLTVTPGFEAYSESLGLTKERGTQIYAAVILGLYKRYLKLLASEVEQMTDGQVFDGALEYVLNYIDQESKGEIFYAGMKFGELVETMTGNLVEMKKILSFCKFYDDITTNDDECIQIMISYIKEK